MPTDDEPRPRDVPLPWRATEIPWFDVHALPRDVLTPAIPFLDVLRERTSRTAGPVPERELASVLWHAMLLREARAVGRFGIGWESRSAPSAGGLWPLRILCIPVGPGPLGMYEPERHVVRLSAVDGSAARTANTESVAELTGARTGTTLQIVADPTRTGACYESPESLLLRDAGALTATICLVATALGLASCPLGRAGTAICRMAGVPAPLIGLGAVHLGALSTI